LGEVNIVSTLFSAIKNMGFRFTCIGILISELGSESIRKFPGDISGRAGSIFWGKAELKYRRAVNKRIPFPVRFFMAVIESKNNRITGN
jgi:hypothetical protein